MSGLQLRRKNSRGYERGAACFTGLGSQRPGFIDFWDSSWTLLSESRMSETFLFVLLAGMEYLLIGVYMFVGGAIICGFNRIVEEMDFKETFNETLDSIKDPQRKEMYRKMFK